MFSENPKPIIKPFEGTITFKEVNFKYENHKTALKI